MSEKEITEDATPSPRDLIKSIAEQGYSFEAALADLIDNSITASADKVEILVDTEQQPFTLFLADNGKGMDEATLRKSMQFPSASPDKARDNSDLGRFGLGLKTASFSQTRRFTVISRKQGKTEYSGRTWDVNILDDNKWKIIVNSDVQIKELLDRFFSLSKDYLNSFDEFSPNTIVVWRGLHKFENYLFEKDPKTVLKKELTEITTEHLEMVFHRFMENKSKPLKIRVNNLQLKPFDPFPIAQKGFRPIEYKQRNFGDDSIKVEGFIIPSRAIEETRNGQTSWTTRNRSLLDMEGIYIYRLNRIILFGGWHGLIKKIPRLQLARLRVDIGNSADHLLHLNVAKSQVIIPHDLRKAFEDYIEQLKVEAEREFYNRGIRKFNDSAQKGTSSQLFLKTASNKGTLLELNQDFVLLKAIEAKLTPPESSQFRFLLKMINTTINQIRQSHSDRTFVADFEKDRLSIDDLKLAIQGLKENGINNDFIKKEIIPSLGFEPDSIPEEIIKELD